MVHCASNLVTKELLNQRKLEFCMINCEFFVSCHFLIALKRDFLLRGYDSLHNLQKRCFTVSLYSGDAGPLHSVQPSIKISKNQSPLVKSQE